MTAHSQGSSGKRPDAFDEEASVIPVVAGPGGLAASPHRARGAEEDAFEDADEYKSSPKCMDEKNIRKQDSPKIDDIIR